MAEQAALAELGQVPWRERTDERWLRRYARIWHAWTLAYTVPFVAARWVAAGWTDPSRRPIV